MPAPRETRPERLIFILTIGIGLAFVALWNVAGCERADTPESHRK